MPSNRQQAKFFRTAFERIMNSSPREYGRRQSDRRRSALRRASGGERSSASFLLGKVTSQLVAASGFGQRLDGPLVLVEEQLGLLPRMARDDNAECAQRGQLGWAGGGKCHDGIRRVQGHIVKCRCPDVSTSSDFSRTTNERSPRSGFPKRSSPYGNGSISPVLS